MDLIDRLSTLAAQRTARTDRVYDATRALLAKLEGVTDRGATVTVDGYSLSLVTRRSNVGYEHYWELVSARGDYDGTWCLLDAELGQDSYLHGDFNCRIVGPKRADLLAFASRAPRFVAALLERAERIGADLDSAAASLETASSAVAS